MRWIGKISPNIKATMRLNDALLSDGKKTCRCGALIDLSQIAEENLGLKLGIALKNIEDRIQWTKRWNANIEEALKKKILLDKFLNKQLRLWAQYEEKDWEATEASYSTNAVCSRCQTSLGELVVMLTVNAPEALDLTKNQLIDLPCSPEMLAYVSKRLGFASIEQLKEWRDNADAEQAKAILRKTITELDDVNLSYETSRITGTLTTQIEEIDNEIRGRCVEFVDAVERVLKERMVIIK